MQRGINLEQKKAPHGEGLKYPDSKDYAWANHKRRNGFLNKLAALLDEQFT